MDETVKFLKAIYGGFGHDGVITIVHILKQTPRSAVRVFKYHLSEVESLDWGPHLEANREGFDIYFGASLRKPEFLQLPGNSRGGVEDCSLSTCLALDIDFQREGVHQSEKLPSGLEEAASIFEIGPTPSIAIDSGYGIHTYWIYRDPIHLASKKEGVQYGKRRKEAHAPYVAFMKEQGWHCDSTWTPDRIWRLPGFLNWKIKDDPKHVEVLYGLEEPTEKYDLNTLAPVREKKTSEPTATSSFLKSTKKIEKAECVENLPKALKAYADKYYEDALEAEKSSEPEDREAAVELKQKAAYINKLLKGESIEEKGNRDFALTKICGIICFLTSDIEEYSEADLEYIVSDLMRPSLEKWVEDSEEETDIIREMEKSVDKLERIKAKDRDKQQAGLRELAKALKRKPRAPLEDGPPEEEGESKADLLKCGLIIYGEFTYVWDWPKSRYYTRFVKNPRDLKSVIRDCWPEDDSSCPFKHSFIDEEGKAVDIAQAQLERLYSRAAESSYYSFCVDQTCFDTEDRSYIINPAPYRYMEAVYNKDINQWLKYLGGEEHYGTLCDWLAGLTHLDKPCAALYLDGPPGCGKSLFGIGAAQLWTKDVPLYEHVARNFNEELLKSPVALIDEGISQEIKNASMVMRRLVAQGSHSVNKKNGPLLRLRSYLRFVIAANNDEVLLSGREEKLSENDARAMSERIVYIKIRDDRARDFFIEKNKGNALTNEWINEGGFAKHVLWLSENRDLSNRSRFLIQGNTPDMLNKFLFQGDERNRVLEWITLFCEAPTKVQARRRKDLYPAEIGNGVVALNTKLMKDCWGEYASNKEVLEHSHLLRHLKALSSRSKAVKIWTEKGSARYWVIPVDRIIVYAETHDIGDVDHIRELAEQDKSITKKIVSSDQYLGSKTDI